MAGKCPYIIVHFAFARWLSFFGVLILLSRVDLMEQFNIFNLAELFHLKSLQNEQYGSLILDFGILWKT